MATSAIGGALYLPAPLVTSADFAQLEQHQQLLAQLRSETLQRYGSEYEVILKSGYGSAFSRNPIIAYPTNRDAFQVVHHSELPHDSPRTGIIVTPFSPYMSQQGPYGIFTNFVTGLVALGAIAPVVAPAITPTGALPATASPYGSAATLQAISPLSGTSISGGVGIASVGGGAIGSTTSTWVGKGISGLQSTLTGKSVSDAIHWIGEQSPILRGLIQIFSGDLQGGINTIVNPPNSGLNPQSVIQTRYLASGGGSGGGSSSGQFDTLSQSTVLPIIAGLSLLGLLTFLIMRKR